MGCKLTGAKAHPARFPAKLPEFFIRFLTDPGDLVVDIFAGSNTTGSVAEAEGRRWFASEIGPEYVATSVFRFLEKNSDLQTMQTTHDQILSGYSVNMIERTKQESLFELVGR